ncbi:MAG TPA: flagellar motor switch protein FliN [Bacteroidota bacterium]|nr:flagellar motor switch protein FliN [Bacteroidota bacterium]
MADELQTGDAPPGTETTQDQPIPEAAKIESSKMKAPNMEEPVMQEAALEAPGTSPAESGLTVAEPAQFPPLEPAPAVVERDRKMDLLLDLTLPVAIELGRTNLQIRDILDLRRGSVVEFEKLASEPVDVIVNGKKMAEGEVVVIEKHFGIRITNLIETAERVKSLGK